MGQNTRTALVTGASSGIDLELSRLLAADGYDLIIVGRDRERLAQLGARLRAEHQISVRCESWDLSESGVAFRLWAEVTSSARAIDVLVNNAGTELYGLVQEQTPMNSSVWCS